MYQESRSEPYQNEATIVTSTIFKLSNPGEYSEKYHYSRYGNPSRDSLEASLAAFDGAAHAVTFSSKAAATLALLSSLKKDDLVIFSGNLLDNNIRELQFSCRIDFIDVNDLKSSIRSAAKLVWVDTMTNRFEAVLDIKAISDVIHTESNAILVVDNTLTPSYQNPMTLGADAVIYSLGEYIGGHCDVTMVAVLTNDEKLAERLRYYQFANGATPSPFNCFIISRSLKTLKLRMDRHALNAAEVAKFLKTNSKVENVFHVSLNCGVNCPTEGAGVMSILLKGSSEKFAESLKRIMTADSLGGTDTTVSFSDPEGDGIAGNISTNLIRLSIGIEDVIEIIADLDQALRNIE